MGRDFFPEYAYLQTTRVSFEEENSLPYPVISGEGEKKWLEFLELTCKEEAPSQEVLTRWRTFGTELPELIPPYLKEDFPHLKNRIVYFETSRGCPYLCSFCLSALDKTVRYFDKASIQSQIQVFHQAQDGLEIVLLRVSGWQKSVPPCARERDCSVKNDARCSK